MLEPKSGVFSGLFGKSSLLLLTLAFGFHTEQCVALILFEKTTTCFHSPHLMRHIINNNN